MILTRDSLGKNRCRLVINLFPKPPLTTVELPFSKANKASDTTSSGVDILLFELAKGRGKLAELKKFVSVDLDKILKF